MKYLLIDMIELDDSFQFYAEHTHLTPFYKGNSVDEWADEIIKRAEKNDKLLKQLFITYRENKDLILDESSIEIINKILGDCKIRSKCRIVNDGSYLNNRIYVYISLYDNLEGIRIRPELGFRLDPDIRNHFYNLPVKKAIDWLYNHFDTIFVHPILVKNREDICDEIDYQKVMQELDDMMESY